MSRIVATVLAVVLALVIAVHVGIPAYGMPAPVPVLLGFAAVLGTLAYKIVMTVERDGLFPVWLRVTP